MHYGAAESVLHTPNVRWVSWLLQYASFIAFEEPLTTWLFRWCREIAWFTCSAISTKGLCQPPQERPQHCVTPSEDLGS